MRLWLILAAVLISSATAPLPRRMYVVGCGGQVDIIDTVSGVRLQTVDIAQKLPIMRSQTVAGATFDGCLLNQAIYDKAHAVFYSAVPDQFSNKRDGTKDYHVFRFTLPGLQPSRLFSAGTSLDTAPALGLTQNGKVQVGVPAPTGLDLSHLGSKSAALSNQVLETSGSRTLLRLFGSKQLSLAVVDVQKLTLTQLTMLPVTTALNVHLVPGGAAVYVEEVVLPLHKTGRAFIFDAADGKQSKTIVDRRIAAMSFIAVSPNGRVVYRSADRYAVIPISGAFGTMPVVSAVRASGPAVFFSER